MFSILRAAISFIGETYTIYYQVIATSTSGVESVISTRFFTITANIQNQGSLDGSPGEQIYLGREGSLGFKTIIILSTSVIGLDDPVYSNGTEDRYLILYDGKFYRIMMEGIVQVDGYFRYHGELVDFLVETPILGCSLIFEDGAPFLFEDGALFLLENCPSTGTTNMAYEDNAAILSYEDGAVLTYEGQ